MSGEALYSQTTGRALRSQFTGRALYGVPPETAEHEILFTGRVDGLYLKTSYYRKWRENWDDLGNYILLEESIVELERVEDSVPRPPDPVFLDTGVNFVLTENTSPSPYWDLFCNFALLGVGGGQIIASKSGESKFGDYSITIPFVDTDESLEDHYAGGIQDYEGYSEIWNYWFAYERKKTSTLGNFRVVVKE